MTTQHSTHEMVYGAFLLGDIELAINAHELQEVVNLPDEMDKVPLSPDYLMGVFSLRESIVPVINMRVLLKQPDSPETDDARRDCIAIIRVGSNRMGLLFDRTSEVLRIGRDNIELFAYPDGDVDSRGPVQGVISLDEGSRLRIRWPALGGAASLHHLRFGWQPLWIPHRCRQRDHSDAGAWVHRARV